MRAILKGFIVIIVFLGPTHNYVSAEEGTEDGCPKVCYMETYTKTYQNIYPLDDSGTWCQIDTIVETGDDCRGDGSITCCPGVKNMEVVNSVYNVRCPV